MNKVIEEGALRLQITESTCDVVISCPDMKLMAHKLILSIASPVFRELLVQKVSSDITTSSCIIMPDVSGTIMSAILDYIYSGHVMIFKNDLNEFLSIAQFFKIKIDSDVDHNLDCPVKKDKTVIKEPDTKKQLALERMKKTICKVVVPSPWCRRDESSFLDDPRAVSMICQSNKHSKSYFEDSNNNFQCERVELPKFTNFPFSRHLVGLAPPKFQPPEKASSHDDDEEVEEIVKKPTTKKKKKSFRCPECGKCFSQLRNFKYHRSVHEGTREFSAKCPECGKTFNDRGYLSSHMKIHRDRKEYACPNCPKRFNQRVAYNMHLRIHTGVKPHECPTCGKSFSRKMLLKQHQRVHTGERPYSCPECGKTFADRSNMSLHARLHTGVKPYACTVCPKSFTKKHHLKTHMNFHTGLKPYSCENCGLAFSQSSNMRTHYKKCILKDRVKTESISSAENNSS